MRKVAYLAFFLIYLQIEIVSSISIGKGFNIFSRKNVDSTEIEEVNDEENQDRILLPKLLPHPDKDFILEFYLEKNPSCEYMRPIVKRAEKKFNIKVKRIPLMAKSEYLQLYDLVGGNEYGNAPFYYNRRTAQAIGGATSYNNLCSLINGDKHVFIAPPEFELQKNEYNPDALRGIGVQNYWREKITKTLIKSIKSEKTTDKTKNPQSSKKSSKKNRK